mmetsp:Transcript_9602/g.27721  ORF Transcript_9602/g.27721 Transcript_9602/m.27721 type:complete len:134 (-) Transcript_9602:107-508(-)
MDTLPLCLSVYVYAIEVSVHPCDRRESSLEERGAGRGERARKEGKSRAGVGVGGHKEPDWTEESGVRGCHPCIACVAPAMPHQTERRQRKQWSARLKKSTTWPRKDGRTDGGRGRVVCLPTLSLDSMDRGMDG